MNKQKKSFKTKSLRKFLEDIFFLNFCAFEIFVCLKTWFFELHQVKVICYWAKILRLTHTFAYLFGFPGEY